MTEDKAKKKAIRRRMAKTGERYTAARRHVAKSPDPVEDPGMSDATIKRGSGKTWPEWFRVLDGWGAKTRTHTEIARHVNQDLGVPGWWAQSVAVGYERARGMRARYQRPTGFEVGVSKTFPVSAKRLFSAFADAGQRRRWLEPGTLRTRTTLPGKTARFDFRDGATRVHVYFVSKGRAKATVHIQHERLPDARAVEDMRAFWKERLTELGRLLG
jgi:hypothetical protein